MNFNNIAVVGIARNCGEFIISEIERLEKALNNYNNVQFLIIESDSNDNTLEKLEYLKNTIKNFHYITLGELESLIPVRTERLAFCRNKYLEELENNKLFQNTEYVLVSDLDGMNKLLTKENIASCWEISDWDVCTANQKGFYYDLWALRHPLISPNDCWKVYHFMVNELGLKSKQARRKALKSRMFWFQKSLKPFEVDSAFSGLAIYKRHTLYDVRYIGVDDNGYEICEHVALNKQIKEKGFKIYINPKLINCYTPTQYVKSKFKKMLLGFRIRVYSLVKN
ncbi:glycosyltransferase family protein [Confluentibacter lentus]|uniref:hypothetical protein n=1 Tax=Confluentibacter lentus TaxID=1699412 RepID=UPI000C287684|nr:hypothetical protein [Confluentibacter lentus]